ncbi:MAG TPA: single-stranded DNA-binding protein [Saprospiraceae bacterium]|jgi:single-strand DNA-binding protein|nr:single-stranded DNA-binding protein [Saprospiraceae bacterium]HMP12962.1 single-stranded DNA-binding protein [Saprospiraceae bacterium]
MNSIRNSVTLIGNLGKDPDLKKLDSGTIVARLSLATNESYRNQKGERVTSTQWHTLVAWGKTAELMNEQLKKGKEIAVRGKLTYRNYEDKNGVARSIPEIVVTEFVMISA